MPSTPILGITQVSTSQSGKETTINDAIIALEAATNATLDVSMAAGNVTLTDTEATRHFIFEAQSATTARELKFPISVNGNDYNRVIVVRNQSGYSLTVKFASGAGTTVVIPNNQSRLINAADGLNMTVAAEPPSVIAFLSLTDVPGSYTGEAGRFLAVNVAENALEFIDGAVWPDFTANAGKYLVVNETEDGVEWVTAPIPEDFLDLTDTPDSYSGQALKMVRVNAAADALEFFDLEEPEAVEYVSATRWRIFALEPGVWPDNGELEPEDPEYITPTDQIGFGEVEWLDVDGINLVGTGTPLASSEETGFEAELAFDSITTGGNGWVTEEGVGGDPWVEYEFATPVVPRNVRLWSVNGAPYYSPMQFQIEYWNGTEWVNLGVRTPAAWADAVSQTFKVNGVPYDVLTEAPEDDSIYGRRNAAWIKINAVVTPDATTSYDLADTDVYQYRRFTDAGSKVINVRTDATHPLSADAEWHFHNAGLGSITITPAVGVTINTPPDGTLVVPEDGTVTLKRVAADTFDLFGTTVKVTATDAFPDLTGNADKVLAVTDDELGVEWIDPPAGYTDEEARDAIAAALVAGDNITIDIDDVANTITINGEAGSSELPDKTGNGEKLLAVTADETGVEWIDPPESYPDFVGNAEKVLAVNETEDGVEWVEMAAGGGLSSAFPFSGALVHKAGAQALADATTTTLTFDTEQYDEGGWHDTVTNNSRLTVPAGVTKVRVGARVARASAVGQLVVNIRKNGSGTYTGQAQGDTTTDGTDHVTIWSPVLDVIAGDYFEATAYVDGASNIDGGAGNTWFAIEAVQMAAEANSDGQNVFRASLNTLKSNVTGAGGSYQIPYDTVNQSRSFCTLNTATGAVTINESGTYYLESNVRFSGGSTADWLVYDIYKNGVFHKRSGAEFTDEAVVMAAVDGMIDCSAGDVLTFLATVGGGTLIYDIIAADAGSNTLHITKLSTGARNSVQAYPVPMGFTSSPVTNEVLLLHVFNEPVDFEDDWLGSTAYVGTNPTATVTLTIGKIVAGVTTTVGTVTISTGGVVTFATTGTTVGFISGETMIVTQTSSTDATVKNVALNFKGYRP